MKKCCFRKNLKKITEFIFPMNSIWRNDTTNGVSSIIYMTIDNIEILIIFTVTKRSRRRRKKCENKCSQSTNYRKRAI